MFVSRTWIALGLAAATVASACQGTSYVAQAGLGQLDLFSRRRELSEVLADPAVDAHERVLLAEVPDVLRYAEARGLRSKGNYQTYVPIRGGAVVWFTAASRPLSFEAKSWNFPIVGSFTYLGWFDFREALRFRDELRDDGWDVYLRGVRAYSTGGWFRDPVLSTMLPYREEGIWPLVNVLMHELTHANILVNDQSTFNESLASFVGDTMTEEYLLDRFGDASPELQSFREDIAEERERGERLSAAYAELDAIYRDGSSEPAKLAAKRKVLDRLDAELDLVTTPNNAMLLGFRTYNAGLPELGRLYQHCGRDWARFFRSVRSLEGKSFPAEQTDDIGPVIAKRIAVPCR